MGHQMYIARERNGYLHIYVKTKHGDKLPHMKYLYYSKREAIREYRRKFNLRYKKIAVNEIEFRPITFSF